MLVCWDQWYPEGARITSLQGANVLFYPTAIGWHPAEKAQYGEAQLDAWRTMQRAHAISNGVFVAAVNRTGFEGPPESGLEFWGNSFVADPFGRVMAQATGERGGGSGCRSAIRSRWTKCAETGRFCATAASMRTHRLRSAGWLSRWQLPSPHRSGFRMPAEWEPHEATWLAWPHEDDATGRESSRRSRGSMARLSGICRAWRRSHSGRRRGGRTEGTRVLKKCGGELAAVEFFQIPTDRSWTRDFCPIFVRNDRR